MHVTIFNENIHEKEMPEVCRIYPGGIHGYLKSVLETEDITVSTATLDDLDTSLSDAVLEKTDVLLWWGHAGHHLVPDELAERVQLRVLMGMGLIVLHSGHHSKVFKRLMGTSCNLKWRDGAKERLWVVAPNHPIVKGVPETFTLECEEMYGERFDIPTPDELILLGWFNGGEVFRSGCTFTRGLGKIFYFQPGHETNPSYTIPEVQTILKNAVRWACPIEKNVELTCPHFQPLEK